MATIMVPAHNEEASMGFVLGGLLNDVYERSEVPVVRDGSADTAYRIASASHERR